MRTTTNKPTSKQLEVYNYMVQYVEANGRQPTLREIAREFKMQSPAGPIGHLKALQKKGYLIKTAYGSKGFIFPKLKFVAISVGN